MGTPSRAPTPTLLHSRLLDLRRAALPIAQATLAAGAAWFVARHVIDHPHPFFAPIAAVISVGASFLERGRRTAELVVGVALGIAVGDILIAGIGVGTLQMMLVVALAMAAAVLVGGGPLLITQAAVSAVLVATLQPPTSGIYWGRFVDALVGGSLGLLVTALLPVDPVALARRAVVPLLEELAATIEDVAAALSGADAAAVGAALARARAIDVSAFHGAVQAGAETARLAPQRWRSRPLLADYATADPALDFTTRNVRLLARGAVRAVELHEHVPPELEQALRELAGAVRALAPALGHPERADRRAAVRDAALRAAAQASLALERTGSLSVSVLVGQVRSTATDLLRALGLESREARDAVRAAAARVLEEAQ
ncbi:MAG: FUSC family protein [Actinobacteria bacterium]|nr:FUSC family protein [Actinomycetota bacterium]